MSIDNNSQCVKSKYFTCSTVMDDSLTDFQETKQNCKGPKTTQKTAKPKQRKVLKQTKGQKDIKTALSKKKNDIVAYTKEFDTVCKKSGVDVDSEQLQLAIALSKSLQTQSSDDASTSKVLSTQGRISRIKSTLQEFGFKVPDSKIATVTNRRKNKCAKQYKLLNTTEEERYQKINCRYSEILFECLESSKFTENCLDRSNSRVYNIGTILHYESMKDNSVFYVDNLVEKSITTGSLLRDWSEIPGRPVSPVHLDKATMNFSEIMCSQDELDVILSGSLKSIKTIFAKKQLGSIKKQPSCLTDVVVVEDGNAKNTDRDSLKIKGKCTSSGKEINSKIEDVKNLGKKTTSEENIEVVDLETNNTSTIRELRCCSPDIFDDEVSGIIEMSDPVVLSQGQKTKVFTEETNLMDMTECIANNVLSQDTRENTTKRKSNDFMEITECAVTASQGIHEITKEIDLTQSCNENSIMIVPKLKSDSHMDYDAESLDNRNQSLQECNQLDVLRDNNAIILMDNLRDDKDIDLTQSSDEDNNQTKAVLSEKNSIKESESMDLTQSSKSSVNTDELPAINVGRSQQSQQNLDDTIILNEEEYLGSNAKVRKDIVVQNDKVFDLTQEKDTVVNSCAVKSQPCSQNFYDDFVHNHSDSSDNIEPCGDKVSVHDSKDLDLTQTSEESGTDNINLNLETSFKDIPINISLGKRDDLSIDYDEICEYISDEENDGESNSDDVDKRSVSPKNSFTKSQVCDDLEVVDDHHVSNLSQNSDVFDLTDKELDYSLHKSRLDIPIDNYNIDFGGISVMDNVSGVKSFRRSSAARCSKVLENGILEESFLPDVNLKKSEDFINLDVHKPSATSPDKLRNAGQSNKEAIPNVTPKNTEYMIKTDQVTPMLDYASMTTPQRNIELDKYGLKPFKRKRAIQILTHLYNQTHPFVEPDGDDVHPSPSKKPKSNSSHLHVSPRKFSQALRKPEEINKDISSTEPSRNSKSPRKVNDRNTKADSPNKEQSDGKYMVSGYEVTNEVQSIRSIEENPEEWVFQKREKAKVHSCRVPLHIAFYNYVSSRQNLREAILRYEPINIDVVHKDLVSYGHRYDPKDLLRFLDRKCITVKTADNNARNKR